MVFQLTLFFNTLQQNPRKPLTDLYTPCQDESANGLPSLSSCTSDWSQALSWAS